MTGPTRRTRAICAFLLLLATALAATPGTPAATAPSALAPIPDPAERKALGVDTGDRHTCALAPNGNVLCWGSNVSGQSTGHHGEDGVNVSLGADHSCVLLQIGNVRCWGDNGSGQAAPYLRGDATQVAAGKDHTCVLTVAGNVHCWGDPLDGRLEGYDNGDAVFVAAGGAHTCALVEGGNVACWGANYQGQADDYDGGDALQVTVGASHSCALLEDGSVTCWGNNCCGESSGYARAQTATEDATVHCQPNVPTAGAVRQPRPYGCIGGPAALWVDAGSKQTCAVVEGGNAYCWGLSNGVTVHYEKGDAVRYAGGGDHGCVLTTTSTVRCWGSDSHGQSAAFPQRVTERLDAGDHHSCLLVDGTVSCWGEQTGTPYEGTDVVQIAVGPTHSCALLLEGNVACWGDGATGKTDPYEEGDAIKVAAGGGHTCVLRADGSIRCWGDGTASQAGDYAVVPGMGSAMVCDSPRPQAHTDPWVACVGGVPAVDVATGIAHTCVLLEDGRVYCWGAGFSGHAPSGPVAVIDAGATQLRAGWLDTCALLVDGEVRCWRDDYAFYPVFAHLDDPVELAVGNGHICVLRSTGQVECAGSDTFGEASDYPGTDALQAAAGASHTCVLRTTGDVACWGANENGQAAGFQAPMEPSSSATTQGDGLWAAWWWALPGVLLVAAIVMSQIRPRTGVSTTPEIGAMFLAKYDVKKRIGLGGFGAVWLAHHVRMKRPVVIKELHAQWSEQETARKRFAREAEILATLDHPNVTRIYDVEEVAGKQFLIMEYVAGGTLKDLVAPSATPDEEGTVAAVADDVLPPSGSGITTRGRMRVRRWLRRGTDTDPAPDVTSSGFGTVVALPDLDATFAGEAVPVTGRRPGADAAPGGIPTAEAGRMMLEVLAGLEYIHGQGIQHRDLKPSNILLTEDGQAKIADFGVSRSTLDTGETMTLEQGPAGTPLFMAPEQIAGKDTDARADLYAAAATLYWALTGHHYLPDPQAHLVEVHRQILEAPPLLPIAGLDERLNAWLARGLAKRPDRRFTSTREARRSLARALDG